MAAPRLQGISLRLSDADIRRVKAVSARLGIRESDLLRHAIRSALFRLAPLADPAVRGKRLMPVLLEHGPELIREFGFDRLLLGALVNEGVPLADQVSQEDLGMLVLLATGGPTAPSKAELTARFRSIAAVDSLTAT